MSRLGSFVRRSKGPQYVIQKHDNGGLVYYIGGNEWTDSPIAAKIYQTLAFMDLPAGTQDVDYQLVQIS